MHLRNKLLLTILTTLPCAFAQAEVEQRDLRDFTRIDASGGLNVDIRIGAEFLVEVESEDEDLANIVTDVRNGRLRMRVERDYDNFRGWGNDWSDDYNVVVVMPALTEIEAGGGTEVIVDGTVTGDELEINGSGGASIEVDVAVERLDITASGGADLEISGTANFATAESSGGSDIDARNLEAKEAELRASGGSDLAMGVTEALDARASGAADIDYYGDPQVRDIDESGQSDITRH
jgi:hypothetical protein